VTGETLGDVLRRIGRLAGLQGVLALTDAQLLERFAVGRDEPAFAALMVRHGPMVLGVCRRLLHDADQAEDAFQAAFLVLARKAGAIKRQPLLSAWLYGVAYKVAARLRGRTWKRQARENQGVDLASVAASVEPDPSELPPLLHQEVQRLPDKYRNPIVLCYLQGKTHEEAALLLRWPLGTVKGRLSRARDLLRSRLTRRGVTASEGVMATALAANPTTASAKLMDTTIRAATRFAAGDGGAGGLVSARAIALTQGALRTMILTKMKIVGAMVLAVTMIGSGSVGAGWLALRAAAEGPKGAPKPDQAPAEKPAPADKAKDDKAAAPQEAIPKIRTAADRARSSNNLKELALAMQTYADAHGGGLPAAAVYDKDGKPLLSWRVLILPQLNQERLFNEFHLDEPWDGDHNKKLLEKMPTVFASSDEKAFKNHETYYQGFVGKGAGFEGTKGLSFPRDFVDGTSNTILFVEAKKAVPWTKPEDIPFDAGKLLPKLGGLEKNQFLAAMFDGSVRGVPLTVKEDDLRTWIIRNSGKTRPALDK
jgi:RNA polymerase sigma factor (sigma-70 family)